MIPSSFKPSTKSAGTPNFLNSLKILLLVNQRHPAVTLQKRRAISAENSSFQSTEGAFTFDPIRIIQAVIVGVSFIGAGTILKLKDNDNGSQVKYLTTAASLLFSAGIGICVAVERFITAIGVTILILLINGIFWKIENRDSR